ncbi:MAG: hypothetical protein AB1403_05500 [Candidatus Riflebacteria bacterium]
MMLNAHEPINEAAVSYFTNKFGGNSKSIDSQVKFLGVAWHSGAAKEITEDNSGVVRSETFENWVKIGGVDADVNSTSSETVYNVSIEKPLRHFYDPEEPPKYLTDFSDRMKKKVKNPNMDHIEWALTKASHQWSFSQGLFLYKAAMENTSKKDLPSSIANFEGYFSPNNDAVKDQLYLRENLFAASFRALGETLHGVADLCMPAHVRDDSHGGWDFIGGDDPIESTIGYDKAVEILKKSVNPPDKSFLEKGKSAKEIMEGCAIFTNKNFFSFDTVCNTNPSVKPNTYNKKFYSSPSFSISDIQQVAGEKNKERIYKIFSNVSERVIIAEKRFIDNWIRDDETKYLVPKSAAEGQASVLLPLAAAAGGEIIDRFLPTMNLGLTVEKDNGASFKLIASLTHEIEKDIEWQSVGEIKYNGFGEIHVNGSAVATATFENGQMTATATFNDKDKVQLLVKAGALIHKSNIVEVAVEEAIPPKLICSKPPEFIQFLKGIGVDDSFRRIGYVRTKSPEIMAIVQVSNVDYILFNWWFEGASGDIVHEYYNNNLPDKIIPYYDIDFFGEYGQISKNLEIRPRLDNGISYCAPAGQNKFHLEGFYADGYTKDSQISEIYPPSGLLGQPGKYKTISIDVDFEVQAMSSPAKQYEYADGSGLVKREISFSKIEQNTKEPESGFRIPAWAPSTWLMSFKFDGSYTYYFSPSSKPDDKIAGFYKAGVPSGHWVINNFDRWEFDYNESGKIVSGVEKYNSGSLIAKYTDSDYVQPSFLVTHDHFSDSQALSIKNAKIETFGDQKEIYHVADGSTKEGPYSYSNISKTVTGFYKNNIPTGNWEINYSGKWLFELDSEGKVLNDIKKYDNNGKLVARYTLNKYADPSFHAVFSESSLYVLPKTAYVEAFSDAKEEKYYIVDGLKEGLYSSITPKGETASGQYSHDQKTGTWTYYRPNRTPPEYTETY